MRKSKEMTEGKEYWSENWNATAANYYTKSGDTVTMGTIYRYGKRPPEQTRTLAEWDAFIDGIERTKKSEAA